jgi:hypothetical protein
MAPKAKAPAKAVKATVTTAKPKGLQLSAAQWKAYDKAYSAVVTAGFAALRVQAQNASLARRRAAFNAGVQSIMRSRLNVAHKLAKITEASHRKAQTAAIAAFAAKMSYRQSVLGHQNAALKARIFADYERHVRQSARLQYIYKGENVYRHTAVMRTLTTAQATSLLRAQQAKAARTAVKALKSVSTSGKAASSAANKAAAAKIRAQARTAGLAAANAVPVAKRGRPKSAVKSAKARAKAHRTAHNTASATAKATIAARKKGVKRAPRTAPRPPDIRPGLLAPRAYGNPAGYDCVAAAIANHLLYETGYRIGRRAYSALADALGGAPVICDALEQVMKHPPWGAGGPLLAAYVPVEYPLQAARKTVAGVCSPEGSHAVVALETGSVVSWGEILPLREVCVAGTGIEEAWDLLWILPRQL